MNLNKRMNELDDIAQTYAGRICGNDEDSNYNAWFNVYKKKFAELIVRECMDQCEDMDDRYRIGIYFGV